MLQACFKERGFEVFVYFTSNPEYFEIRHSRIQFTPGEREKDRR